MQIQAHLYSVDNHFTKRTLRLFRFIIFNTYLDVFTHVELSFILVLVLLQLLQTEVRR